MFSNGAPVVGFSVSMSCRSNPELGSVALQELQYANDPCSTTAGRAGPAVAVEMVVVVVPVKCTAAGQSGGSTALVAGEGKDVF